MAVGDTLPHCTGTGTSADPYIYSDLTGFLEAIAVTRAYVEAAEENLVLDTKGSRYTVSFAMTSLNGKGSNLLNLHGKDNNVGLIVINNKDYTITIKNMNFLNMILDGTGNNSQYGYIIQLFASEYSARYWFDNCNFTCLVKGNPLDWGEGYGLIHCDNNWSRQTHRFKDCTFNLNFDNSTAGTTTIFTGKNAMQFTNCTVCLSGKTKKDIYVFRPTEYGGFTLNNCTIMNKPTNPLILDSSSGVKKLYFYNTSGGTNNANYIKLHIEVTNIENPLSLSFSNFNKTLVNRSLISSGYFSASGAYISMQETDPTADDYIYDAEKLAAKGFNVGQVIE